MTATDASTATHLPRRQLQTVEAGRGLAATLVVLYHCSAGIFPASKYWNERVFGGVLDFGYAGVEFFFVLSGFIIAYAHWADIGQSSRLRNFVRRRFVRIYPSYWVVLAMMIGLSLTGLGPRLPAPADIAGAVTLLGRGYETTIVGVAWTLYHEVAFYLVFALLIVAPRVGIPVGIAAMAAAALRSAGIDIGLPFYWEAPVNLLFPMGIAAWLVSRTPWRGGAVAIAGAAAFLAVGLTVVYRPFPGTWSQLLFGLSAAVGLAGIVAEERRRSITVPPLLRHLGAASYSIYLIHYPVLSALARAAVRFNLIGHAPATVDFVIVVVLTIAIAFVFHRVIERPLMAIVSRRMTASAR